MFKSTFSVGVWSGILVYASVSSLVQDVMGRDAYAAHVVGHWVTWKVSTPLAIVGLLMAAANIAMLVKRKAEKRSAKDLAAKAASGEV